MSEATSESDLNAYVDNQLDIMRRLAGRGLSGAQSAAREPCHRRPARARCAEARPAPPMRAPEAPTIEAAAKMKNRMAWRSLIDKLRKVAAIVLFIGIGWFAHGEPMSCNSTGRHRGRCAGLRRRCHHCASHRAGAPTDGNAIAP